MSHNPLNNDGSKPVSLLRCKRCGFAIPGKDVGYIYVQDDEGRRVRCEKHEEHLTIARVLHLSEEALTGCSLLPEARTLPVDLLEERIGYSSHCLCLECCAFFELDLKKDLRICPKCGSTKVETEGNMARKECPRCGEGILC